MSSEQMRLTGMVKWFNNKSGFGFITVCNEGDYTQKDIFAHYSSIRVTNSQYKYLVQGEYVEFKLVKSDNEKHEYHAMDITGIMGGPILCETRRQTLSMQSDDKRERSRYSKDRGHNRQSTEAQTSTDDSEDALHASA